MAREVQSGSGREMYWRLVLARWKRSGLSVRTSCRAEGLNQGTFYWWRREWNRRDQPKPAFFAVRILPERAESPSGSIEVVLANGRSVRVRAGFDPQTPVRVVELLEGGRSC
jgi:transposase-like protein